MHGGLYQEKGLPDWLVLVHYFDGGRLEHWRFWLEIKAHWKDDKSPGFYLQQHNISEFRMFGFLTGWLVDGEAKSNWDDDPLPLEKWLRSIPTLQAAVYRYLNSGQNQP